MTIPPDPDELVPDDPMPIGPPDESMPHEHTPEEPTPDEPALDEPALDEPALDQPTPDEPALDQPALDEPAAEVPAPEVPSSDVVPAPRGSRVGRVLTGLAVLLLTGAVVGAGTLAPARAPVDVAAPVVDVPAPVTQLVCPGPLRLATEPEAGGDAAYDPQFDPAPAESTSGLTALTATADSAPATGGSTSGTSADESAPGDEAASGTLTPLDRTGAPLETLRPAGGAATASVTQVQGPVVVVADPVGDTPAWVSGVVGVRTPAGDLRGSASASCQAPSPDVWLVGGSTVIGSSARLVLQNPGLTAATVHVDLWGPSGKVELAGSPEYLVPPTSERVVLLEGVAAEQARIVAHVTAAGGLITAYLQDSQLRGLVPAGVDYVVAGQPPAERQVATGVSVTSTTIGGADTAALRLLVPGTRATTAHVQLLGPDGVVALPGADSVRLEPGAVLDLPLGGLAPGDYTAVVDAGQPILLGALVTRGTGVGADPAAVSGAPLDRAWGASQALGAAGPLALPPGAKGHLLVSVVPDDAVSGPASVTVEVVGSDGQVLGRRDLLVATRVTMSLPLDAILGAESSGADRTEVAGVVVRTADPRVAWGAVLLTSSGSVTASTTASSAGASTPAAPAVPAVPTKPDDTISLLSPVPPRAAQPQVTVRLR
ncbi:MAG TPA: DUF5719 family protein [Actinotalea sp.]